MKFLGPIKPRFGKVWRKPIVAAELLDPHPFPGKRRYRWAIMTTRHGFVYEGKPSSQAINHAINLARAGYQVHLLEGDKVNPYSNITFLRYGGDMQSVSVNATLWAKYHKLDVIAFYFAWRKKSRGKARIKARARL